MTLGKTCRMNTSYSNLSKVTAHEVVTCLKTQVGVGIAMVGAAGCRGKHIGEQHTCNVMLVGKGMIVVKMAIPADSLAIGRIRHDHFTRHEFIVLLGQAHNRVFRVIVTPGRNEYGVLVVV